MRYLREPLATAACRFMFLMRRIQHFCKNSKQFEIHQTENKKKYPYEADTMLFVFPLSFLKKKTLYMLFVSSFHSSAIFILIFFLSSFLFVFFLSHTSRFLLLFEGQQTKRRRVRNRINFKGKFRQRSIAQFYANYKVCRIW